MTSPLVVQRRVEWHDTDAAGIAHFTAFLRYMEAAEHELLRRLGLSILSRDGETHLSWPRVHVECDYRGAAVFDDLLEIAVSIDRMGERSVTYRFHFTHQGRDVAKGKITAVCCLFIPGEAPRSVPIPATWIERLRPLVQGGSTACG